MTSIDEHVGKLGADDEADRIYAAEDLGYANQAGAIPFLLQRLSIENSVAVREAIFGALGRIDGADSITAAINLLSSDDTFLRNHAVSLLRMRSAEAAPQLGVAFRQADADERKFILDAVRDLDAPDADAIRQQALEDSEVNVVITALETIGRLRKASMRERVQQMVKLETSSMLLSVCLEALCSIGGPETIGVVKASLAPGGEWRPLHEPAYLKLLGDLGTPDQIGEILVFLDSERRGTAALSALHNLSTRHPSAKLPESAAPALLRLASAKQPFLVRYRALRLLGGLAEMPAVAALQAEALKDQEKGIRMGAAEGLLDYIHLPAARTLFKEWLLQEHDEEVRALFTRREYLN